MTNRSIVSRLIWLIASALAGVWLLGSVAAGLLTRFEVNERLDNALGEVARRLLPATAEAMQQPQAMQHMAEQMVPAMDPRALAYQILSATGQVALRSPNAPEAPFALPLQAGFRDVPHYRVFTRPSAIGAYFIEVAEPTMHRHEALRRAI